MRPKALGALAVSLIAAVGVATIAAVAQPSPRLIPVSAEAAAEFVSTLTSAPVPNEGAGLGRFCHQWADSVGRCQLSVNSLPEEAGQFEVPLGYSTVSAAEATNVGRLVLVEGRRSDGLKYRTQVEVVRDSDGDLTVVDPIYWVGGSFTSTLSGGS